MAEAESYSVVNSMTISEIMTYNTVLDIKDRIAKVVHDSALQKTKGDA